MDHQKGCIPAAVTHRELQRRNVRLTEPILQKRQRAANFHLGMNPGMEHSEEFGNKGLAVEIKDH